MILLELLRQELPKRGGWPEGAAKAVSYDFIPGVHFWDNDGFRVDYSDLTTRVLVEATVTREQYEATGWDGTGLPPVGVECEVLFTDDDFPEWYTFKIVFIGDVHTVAIVGDAEISYVIERLNDSSVQFRPLRTEAERAIDEMVQLSGVSTGAAKILYDAGYRKE